jgi:hypothetical protein
MLLNQLLEKKIVEGLTRTGRSDTAVIGWGRGMGHLGHMYLASSVITHATENRADPYFVVSRTVGKNDPLTPTEKLSIYKKVFAENKEIFQAASDLTPDLSSILGKLKEHGYRKVIVVVGEDRVTSFQYLKNYNGKPTKDGKVLYTFESVDVISRHQTNDPSNNIAGPRADDMRKVLLDPTKLEEDKFSVWRNAMSNKIDDQTVHMIMKLAEHRLRNLSEAKLDPSNIAKLSQIKQQLSKNSDKDSYTSAPTELDPEAQARVDDFAKGMADRMAMYTTDPKSKAIPRTRTIPKKEVNPISAPAAEPNIEFPKDYNTLMQYKATLDQVLANKKKIEKLTNRATKWGPLPRGLLSDIDDSMYADAWKDGYQSLLAKSEKSISALADYIKLKKSLYQREDTSTQNEPYEYIVHYTDPKTRTTGTRTVKTTQPAPKSDSPDAAKFFGKWTSHYSAHEKRSDTAVRQHNVVSQTQKKNEGMMPASNFAGTEKGHKLGQAGHLKGKTKRPAKAGDLVGEQGVVEDSAVPVNEDLELEMSKLISLLEHKI